jgi:serine/threonine-protein kinase PknK
MMLELPPRYEPVTRLGKGGGGEVWAVRDRLTGRALALKTLGDKADEREVEALVREAAALSGLEGLGVPRVLRFGRLPGSGRPYFLRELVEGKSLAELADRSAGAARETEPARTLGAVLDVADQLTRLHRAQLLHGDVKPANVIVPPRGSATLVDLGLVAAFREGGTRPLGLTPRYAAPELFEGGALTVRAEVFALGATLGDVLEVVRADLDAKTASALSEIVERATRTRPEERFPSADEVASELRRAAPSLLGNGRAAAGAAWPIVGLDDPSRALFDRVTKLPSGGGVVVTGPLLAGKSTLLRRLAWSLGAYGRHVAWVQGGEQAIGELDLEMAGSSSPADVVVLVDDADRLPESAGARLGELRAQGARVVIVTGGSGDAPIPGPTLEVFEIAPLGSDVVQGLALLAIPSLPQPALARVLELAEGRPGRLRAVVERLDGAPVVGGDDVDRLVPPDLFSISRGARERARPRGRAELAEVREALLRGHFEDAADQLATLEGEHGFELGVMRAKLFTNQGEWKRAQEELAGLDPSGADAAVVLEYLVELARANLRGGDYAACVKAAEMLEARERAAGDRRALASFAEATALGGMALSFLGDLERSKAMHNRSIEGARQLADPRVLSVALSSAAFSLQRQGRLEEARPLYEEALENAERAGDAGTVATTRLNLAGIAKTQGDLARALSHLEAAVDMGRRSGRRATLRQALLNLANLDLYLGRLARALVSIEQLAAERRELPPSFAAQLLSLEAEAAFKSGDLVKAEALCIACARAYETVGRRVDAAEAHLESVFVRLARSPSGDSAAEVSELDRRLGEIGPALADVSSHRAALELAKGRVAALKGDGALARASYDKSIEAAIATGKKDWLARAYQARAVLSADDGQLLASRRDRESALGVLEEIAARLPRDLREVFWDDLNRRSLREVEQHVTLASPHSSAHQAGPGVTQQARITQDRLARVLEVNRELAGTYDLRRLLERLTDHAIALLSAERGFVILKSARENADFSIHASRDQAGDDPHARFSQSIADRVVRTGEPVVTTSARDDSRMADYVSVHQLMLQSIACVPIRSRSAGTIGALYLETRMRSAATFNDDLPLLVAMADQAAIAIETARLVGENEARAKELERTNLELEAAKGKLEELLGHRTAQLQQTRRDLKSARAVLKSHFGYEGLCGTSEVMRKVYALIDRVKDTDVPVLITGESGTGKEVIARAIHNASPRAKKPFLAINCGAIPEHLLESELFGHVRGAFTGADRDRKGLFREATEGSLMLDEIGEMPQKMQAGLLRVLQEKMVRPVGGSREEPTATRVIAATHRDLAAMVQRGTFREDLFYRLNVIQVRAPSLRERTEDIPILIDHFLGIFAARYNRERRSVSRAALKMLSNYPWPGNVRQLENALLNAWVLSDTPELEPEDFELTDMVPGAPRAPVGGPQAASAALPANLDAHRATERDRILHALSSSNWNRVKAAEICGMPRRTFYRRLKEYGIQ